MSVVLVVLSVGRGNTLQYALLLFVRVPACVSVRVCVCVRARVCVRVICSVFFG